MRPSSAAHEEWPGRSRPRSFLSVWAAPPGEPRQPNSSDRAAPNTSVWVSTSLSVVTGHINAMLWNGVSSSPPVGQIQMEVVLQVGVGGGRGLRTGARGRVREAVFAAGAEPRDRPGQVPSFDPGPHTGLESPRELVHSGERLVGEDVFEGRPGRGDRSALPARVPPTPPMSTRSRSARPSSCSASSADSPYAPAGTPPPIALPMVSMSGSRPHAAVQPPGPAENVWVSSLISRVPYRRVNSRRLRGIQAPAGRSRCW